MTSSEHRASRPVFVSYATADRKDALAVCEAIERRGTDCWISTRDVEPGENYQEAIVRSIRDARAMVLVFSGAANNSDEIKKELSLASRFHVPVMALRIEDVEPSDAFAYELSTRQWIDAFEGWDKSIDALAARLAQISGDSIAPPAASPKPVRRAPASAFPSKPLMIAAALLLVLVASVAAWLVMRPQPAAAHSLQVRLTGFARLSDDLPQTMPDALRDEIIAAFGEDGIVGATTAAAPPPGNAPAYALGGTIRRDGDEIKVIARLTNERSGATLWSNRFSYDATLVARVPRLAAVEATNIVRCGLYGASTYPRALPDQTMTHFMGFCHSANADLASAMGRGLDFARKAVQATPDFSAGWSAFQIAAQSLALRSPPGARKEELLKEALAAADRAIKLDPRNSEAYAYKNYLIDQRALVEREELLKTALKARPLACGCEHHFYGAFLSEVGRNKDALVEFRRAVDVLPLNGGSQFELAESLLLNGRPDEAKEHFDAVTDLMGEAISTRVTATSAALKGDYATALKALQTSKDPLPPPARAWIGALQALTSGDSAAKARAVEALDALPPEFIGQPLAMLLGSLGANRQLLRKIEQAAAARPGVGAGRWLFYPNTAGALRDPAFPAVAQRLGLMKYWRETKTRPDACLARDAPPFCKMI